MDATCTPLCSSPHPSPGTSPGTERQLVDALRQQLQKETDGPVDLVETHISWVLLTDLLACKLKKPVKLPFVDFSTLALRKHFCDEEFRLNRRLAPSLYFSVLPVRGTPEAPRLGGSGDLIDHVVCMRRFPSGALLSEMLAAGSLLPEHLTGLACRIAAFHRDAPMTPLPPPPGLVEEPERTVLDILAQLEALEELEDAGHAGHVGRAGPVAALRAWVLEQAPRLREAWRCRLRTGWVRECHGDLHLANTVLLDGEATAFDCLEFNPALRWIDVMSDVAFLTMDLKAHGRDDLAFLFLDTYLQHTGDYEGVALLRFYEVHRALVRALVGGLQPCAPQSGAARHEDYFALAQRLVLPVSASVPASSTARMLITHGLSGSGKSTLATRLLARQGAIRLRSDVERKRLFGLDPLQRSSGQPFNIYTPEATARTLARMSECACLALQAGYPVIVDAAFLKHAERRAFHGLADALGVPFTILHCHADQAELRRRVQARERAGDDPSEADAVVLERQRSFCEPLRDEEQPFVIEVATDAPVDLGTLQARIDRSLR